MASAEQDAKRMLGNDRVKELIEIKREHIRIKENVTLDFIVSELKNIIIDVKQQEIERDPQSGRITSKPEYRASLEAIKQLSTLMGYNAPKKVDITTNGNDINTVINIGFFDDDKEDNVNEDGTEV